MSVLRGVKWHGRIVQVLRDEWPMGGYGQVFVPSFGWLRESECEVVTLREVRQGVFAEVTT